MIVKNIKPRVNYCDALVRHVRVDGFACTRRISQNSFSDRQVSNKVERETPEFTVVCDDRIAISKIVTKSRRSKCPKLKRHTRTLEVAATASLYNRWTPRSIARRSLAVFFLERIESTLPNGSELSWVWIELTLPKWAERSSQNNSRSSDPFCRVDSIRSQK